MLLLLLISLNLVLDESIPTQRVELSYYHTRMFPMYSGTVHSTHTGRW